MKNGKRARPAKLGLPVKDPSELWNRRVKPLIDYCAANYGAKTELINRFNEGLTDPVGRTQFERWLIPDEKKRTEPRAGFAFRLLDVFDDLQKAA